MTARLIDGKRIASDMRAEIRERLAAHVARTHVVPGLAVIMVGEHPASQVYVRNKRRACAEVGIHDASHDLPSNTSQTRLLRLIQELNRDATVHGILVQLPLPAHIDTNTIIDAIDPAKDVDGFHPHNIGLLAQRRPSLRPCTPFGAMQLLASTGEALAGKDAIVVGASNIVGRPMALELLLAGCTVTVCHSQTRDLPQHVRRADILVVAVGRAGLIRGDWIKPGAIVIDVGINRQADGRLAGDVDFAAARERAAWITPVPGGVGPMTVACLLANTLHAAERQLATR
ncbi:MAG: bifunctional methylenetetrahydrofolate dehydrogenase/methenyltetrahydrofolate cyclohydrolase FolD [Pseudomonadota bacterium]|nr:MAG: bifunctional methylenetetrahydrofolate dehydrogenase/methenyltetrahydrofolate cyclohydrolase FolD [Pseudomonadota bacterium]